MRRSIFIAAGLTLIAAAWIGSGELSGIQAEDVARKPPADLSLSDILPRSASGNKAPCRTGPP